MGEDAGVSNIRLVKVGLRVRRCSGCDDPIQPMDSFYKKEEYRGTGIIFLYYHLECWERMEG